MIYIHYCEHCKRIYMLNGHKRKCNACENNITELNIHYTEYVQMNKEQRKDFTEKLSDKNALKDLEAKYRMYKYTKWYKESQNNAVEEKQTERRKNESQKHHIDLLFDNQSYSVDCVEISGKWELNILGIGVNIAIANPKRDFLNAEKIDNVLRNYAVSSKIATRIKEEVCEIW